MSRSPEPSTNCKLCDQVRPIEESHVIPKFVYRFLSQSSRGAAFRSAENLSLRMQDGMKRRWLCRGCENLLSRPERWFATNVFRPHFLEGALATVTYDPHLYAFACSLIWRALLLGREAKTIHPRATAMATAAEKVLKETLRGWWQPTPFRIAMICSDYIPDAHGRNGEPVPGWNRFVRRGTMIDFQVADGEAYALVKLPGFCFVADLSQSVGTLQAFNIDVMGGTAELALARVGTPLFLVPWLAHRSRETDAEFRSMSQRQKHLIDERLSQAYGELDEPLDHAGASAFLDTLAEEGLTLDFVMQQRCFCGGTLTFGSCHGILLRERWSRPS